MGNHQKKQSASKRTSAESQKKLQESLNNKFGQINRMIEKVMNVPIENSQHRQRLNENYSNVLDFLTEEYMNFKQSKAVMLERKSDNIRRISQAFESLFNFQKKDSLPWIFQNAQIKDKLTMNDRKKLMIFYHIGVLDKYQKTIGGDHCEIYYKNDNSKVLETEGLRMKQRKELRNIVTNIIKDDLHFVVNPVIQRFNQVIEDTFYKDLKDAQPINSQKALNDFQQKLIKRLTKEESDFIFYSFSIITITLTQNVKFLLQKMLSKFIPEIFLADPQLYVAIFCGQIVEKLIFRSKNKALLLAAINVSFNQTSAMKCLDLDFDGNEVMEFLYERNQSVQYTTNQDSAFYGLTSQNQQSALFLNNNQSYNRGASLQNNQKNRNSSQGRSKSPKKLDINKFSNNQQREIQLQNTKNKQNNNNNIHSFLVGGQNEKQNHLDSIQEEYSKQGKYIGETIISEDSQGQSKMQSLIEENPAIQAIQKVGEDDQENVIEVDDSQIFQSHLSQFYHQNLHSKIINQQQAEKSAQSQLKENNIPQLIHQRESLNQNSLNQSKKIQSFQENRNSYNHYSDQNETNPFERDRESLTSDKQRESLHKIRIERDNRFSNHIKKCLQEKYKSYLEEIYTCLEQCLNEHCFFKKIKKAYKFIIKIQDRFAKSSTNFKDSANFIIERDNWYQLLTLVLKSILSIKPEARLDLYILCTLISLLQKVETSGTYLQDFQGLIRQILRLNENTESNLQSQVMTPIQYSEINNLEEFHDAINMQDPQFDFIFNKNSISDEHGNNNIKIQNINKTNILSKHDYMNERTIVRSSN